MADKRNTALRSSTDHATAKDGGLAAKAENGGIAAKTRGRSERFATLVAVVLAALVAFGLRAFHLNTSWDAFIDEVNYLQISQGVLHTGWVIGSAGPFYLHPPAYFYLEAGYIKLFGVGGDLLHQLYEVRYLGVAMAAISAGAILWIGRRLAGWMAGISAAVIFVLDPFSIKMNSRGMLETPTMMWALLGYLVLFSALARKNQVSWGRVVATGVLFGLALLTKEMGVFSTLVPLGICFLLGWALPRVKSAVIGVIAVLVYSTYPAAVYAMGGWTLFAHQKFNGISRLAGFLQITGFNQQGGPSLIGAIIARLDEFATTYALLATGAASVCILLFTSLGRTPARRLLLAWTASSYALLAYLVALGTLEEPFFYYLVIPAMLATSVTAVLVLQKAKAVDAVAGRPTARYVLATLKAAGTILVAALFFWNAYVWSVEHTVPDNGYQHVASYARKLPPGSRVAATNQTAEIILQRRAGHRIYGSVRALRKNGIDYVVINRKLVNEGYKQPPPKVFRWVKAHGKLVYSFRDRDSGNIGVWRLNEHPGSAQGASVRDHRG